MGDVLSKFDYGLNSASSDYDGKNKYLRITDIDEQTHRFNLDNLTSPKVDLKNKDNYILHPGDIVFARTGASVGKTYKYREDDGRVYFAGFLIRGTINKNFDTSFIFDTTLLPKYSNFVEMTSIRSGQPGINSDEYKKYVINIPTINEQKYISKLITNLEELITLQQRKEKQIKLLKKAMLQTLFTTKTVPQLRFKGFTDNWEQHKLNSFLVEYKKKTKINNQYPVLTSSRQGIFFQKDYYDGNQIASKNNIGYNIVPRNYFTYRHMSDDTIFHFNINTLCDYGIVSTLYPVFTTNNQLSSSWLYYYLNYGNDMKRYALLQKQGGSRTYMYLSKLKNMSGHIPSVKEQDNVAKMLLKIDNLIALQQNKTKKLENLKQFLLQNMFI